MTTTGVVRSWDVGEGWGVIDAAETPGGCWADFSSLIGFGDLQPGEAVTFAYEAGQQDGYDFRATQVQPTSREPNWPTVVVTGPTEAYRSTLTITLQDPDDPDCSGDPEPYRR